MGKVTTGCWPCISFLGRRSITIRRDWSEPREMTQNPLDCPFARFSKNFTSWKSTTPTSPTAFAISWSVAHCNEALGNTQPTCVDECSRVNACFFVTYLLDYFVITKIRPALTILVLLKNAPNIFDRKQIVFTTKTRREIPLYLLNVFKIYVSELGNLNIYQLPTSATGYVGIKERVVFVTIILLITL